MSAWQTIVIGGLCAVAGFCAGASVTSFAAARALRNLREWLDRADSFRGRP